MSFIWSKLDIWIYLDSTVFINYHLFLIHKKHEFQQAPWLCNSSSDFRNQPSLCLQQQHLLVLENIATIFNEMLAWTCLENHLLGRRTSMREFSEAQIVYWSPAGTLVKHIKLCLFNLMKCITRDHLFVYSLLQISACMCSCPGSSVLYHWGQHA